MLSINWSRQLLLLTLVITSFNTIQAQDIQALKSITEVSAYNTDLSKYGDLASSLSKGMVDIKVPVYTVSSRELSVPIYLSYDPSGRKVNEVPSWVGAGWSLTAGGMVTRTVRALPDELPNAYLDHAGNIPDEGDPISDAQLIALADGEAGMRPDIFNYNVGGVSGMFLLDGNKEPQSIPANDVKITVDIDGTNPSNRITITTPKGVKYILGEEYTEFTSIESDATSGTIRYASTWYLKEIISANGTDRINFVYNNNTDYTFPSFPVINKVSYYDAPLGATKGSTGHESISENITQTVEGVCYLDKIIYNNKEANFLASTHANIPKVLSQISVDNRQFYFYYNGQQLDRFLESGMPAYQFSYNGSLPVFGSEDQDHWGYFNDAGNNGLLPYDFTTQGEIVSSNNDREPDYESSKSGILTSIQNPMGGITEYYYSSNWYWDDINNINVQTGGLRINKVIRKDSRSDINDITRYEYIDPSNTNRSSGVLTSGSGYIKETPVRDGQYTYNAHIIYNNPLSQGHLYGSGPVSYKNVRVSKGNDYSVAGYTDYKFSVSELAAYERFPFLDFDDPAWLNGRLLEVKEHAYEGPSNTPKRKHVIYNYNIASTSHEIKDFKVSYTNLVVSGSTNPTINTGRELRHCDIGFPYLESKTTTLYDIDNQSIEAETTSTYTYDLSLGHHMMVSQTNVNSDGSEIVSHIKYPDNTFTSSPYAGMYDRNMLVIPLEEQRWLIKGGTEYMLSFRSTVFDTFNGTSYYPSSIKKARFDDLVARSTFENNMTPYIEETAFFHSYDGFGNLQESSGLNGLETLRIFNDVTGTVPIATIANAKKEEVAYTSFEENHIGDWSLTSEGSEVTYPTISVSLQYPTKSMTLQDEQSVSYSYNYSKTGLGGNPKLRFEHTDGTIDEITLVSTSGNGNISLKQGTWYVTLVEYDDNLETGSADVTYSKTNYFDLEYSNTSKTGARSLNLNAASEIAKDDLPTGKYILTFWRKAASVTVNVSGGSVDSQVANVLNANGWYLNRYVINITNSTNSINLTGSGKIDELRLIPTGATMSTTCYSDLYQKIDETGPSHITSYYEYDGYGRLKLIKDQNKDILSIKEYHITQD